MNGHEGALHGPPGLLWMCGPRQASPLPSIPEGGGAEESQLGVAKKIPAGFLKEEIAELRTAPGMTPQGEWRGVRV